MKEVLIIFKEQIKSRAIGKFLVRLKQLYYHWWNIPSIIYRIQLIF